MNTKLSHSLRLVAPGEYHKLLRALEELALSVGLSELSLQASLNAVEFYASAGYATGEPLQHFVGRGVSLPCIAMARALW